MAQLRPFSQIALFVALSFCGACSRMEDKKLAAGGVNYTFPASHIHGFTSPNDGHPYVRLRPPGQPFDLIYSEFSKYRTNQQGKDMPLVTGINDRSKSNFTTTSFPGGPTVCRSDQPYYSCGFHLDDDGVPWSVIFNKDQVRNSEAIRAAAESILRSYRN